MPLTPSPDNPIHALKTSEFAHLIQNNLFSMIGRDQSGQSRTPEGELQTRHYTRIKREEHIAERDNPPNDPMGPPLSQMSSTMMRETRMVRAKAGKKPSFTGGLNGAFGELHIVFIGAGAAFGQALDEKQLGNDDAQRERISSLISQWSDNDPSNERVKGRWQEPGETKTYAQDLAAELATLDKVPVQFTIDGTKKTLMIDNTRIGEHHAPLAHVLFAVGKNSISLTERPHNEVQFLIAGASNFANILTTTDQVHDYLKEQLIAQGIENPDKVLKDSKLSFDSTRAEAMLLAHAPVLKLSDVIGPLVHAYVSPDSLNTILNLVGQQVEEHPPVVNAEQGARLLEAILHSVKENSYYDVPPDNLKAAAELDDKAIRTFLRTSAREEPFDLSRLADNPQVQTMFEIAQARRDQDPQLDRALATFERAIDQQMALDDKYDAVKSATTYEPNTLQRWRDRIIEGSVQSKSKGSLVEAIDSGMNQDAFDAMMANVIDQFTRPDGPPADKNFSDVVRDEMAKRKARAHKDIPPLP